MATYHAEITWTRDATPQDFLKNRYSRRHLLRFDGGAQLARSSSPHVVPLPWSDAAAVDPEEAFVAALSSCHMLWFLSIAARQGFCVDDYRDAAEGVMARNAQGRIHDRGHAAPGGALWRQPAAHARTVARPAP